MHRMVYMSRSNTNMTDAELDKIRETAICNNEKEEVTGILLYVADTFFQVLEGPKMAVKEIFDRVYQDQRHSRVRVLNDGTATERRFPDWSMGFCRLSDPSRDTSAFFELSRAEFEGRIPEHAGEDLVKLMRGFADAKMSQKEPLLF